MTHRSQSYGALATSVAPVVKLPNLVVAPTHSAHKYESLNKSLANLNIEGQSGHGNTRHVYIKNAERKAFIKSLLENEEKIKNYKKFNSGGDSVYSTSNEIFELINEKLTTGYHGVKHLFKSNDVNKSGILTKEGFKCVLNQLCGYITTDLWNKIVERFGLDERETISFEEFILHFSNNQKVRKELAASMQHIEMVELSQSPAFSLLHNQTDMSKKLVLTDLSATYCLALIRSRAKRSDFEPRLFLPGECFKNNCMVMPFHLKYLLDQFNFKLSKHEFEKLWQRVDLNNIGGVKTRIFLRLIGYNPNEDELSQRINVLRAKTCIVDKFKKKEPFVSKRSVQKANKNATRSLNTNADRDISPGNDNFNNLNTVSCIELKDTTRSPAPKVNSLQQPPACESSLSELKLKSMAHLFKNFSAKFGKNDNLIVFLNNKLNEGYISLKTAFEYIDPDHLGHLLVDEFKSVLDEFFINIESRNFQHFLKKYGLVKHNQLVDYQKFLKIFHDQGNGSVTREFYYKRDNERRESKGYEKKLVEFFHNSFISALALFKDTIGEKSTCPIDLFKRLIEQKFSITIEKEQLDNLLEFLHQRELSEKTGQVNWGEFFDKFSKIDPWKYFTDSYEKTVNRASSKSKTPQQLSNELSTARKSITKPIATINEESQQQVANSDEAKTSNQEADLVVSSDDEEMNNMINVASSDEEETLNVNELIKSSSRGRGLKTSKQLKLNLQNELRTIRELEKTIEHLFRTQFHSINKHLAIIDVNKTERLSKAKFQLLVQRLGVRLEDAEVDLLWKDFNSENVLFSNIVRRFFKPDEFNKLRDIKHKIILEEKFDEEAKEQMKSNSSLKFLGQQPKSLTSLNEMSLGMFKSNSMIDFLNTGRNLTNRDNMASGFSSKLISENPELIEKVKPLIFTYWNELKETFQRADVNYKTHVPNSVALDIFRKARVPLSDSELILLCKMFTSANGSQLNYVKMFKYFKSNTINDAHNISFRNSNAKNQQNWSNMNPILRQLILKLRDNNLHERDVLPKDFANLRNIFKRFDALKKGYLTRDEFKKLLAYCQVSSSNENDMFGIFSQYDPDLKGIFGYKLFIKSLIDKTLQ